MAKKKKSNIPTLVLAGVGVVAIAGYLAKEAANKIISNIVVTPGQPQLDITPFLNGYLRLDVPIVIENKNPFPLGLEYFYGVVTFGTITLARVQIPVGFLVPSGGIKTITLDMDIPIAEVTNQIAQLIAAGNIWDAVLNKIELNGKLQVKGNITKVPIPLNNIPIPLIA